MNKFICIYIITLITTISSSFAFIQPSVPTRKIDSLYEKPWGSEGVSYDHTVLSTKHENVTTIQAFIGEFARRAILNGGSSRRRRLAAGDFDELNSLLEGTIFLLPDQFQNVDVPWPFTSVDIFLTQVQCTNVYIEDMILTSNVQSDAEIDVDVKIVNLGLRCTFKWRYDFGFTGSGSAYIVSTGNDVDTRIGFYSEDFNNHAPHSSRIEACSSQINVNDIHFQGGISGTILNLFKSSVKGMIEDEVTDMVCEEMSGMGSDTLSQSLSQISELFEPYLVGVTQNDPLDAQNNLVVPEGTGKLINFQDLGNSTPAMLMSWAMEEANTRFSIHREDENNPGQTDLGINIVVRDMLLDQDGTYHMEVADFFEDPNVFEGHDMVTETTMTVTAVRIKGMDTFRTFEPLVAIGAQTFRTNMEIDEVDIEIDLTLVMKASTHETSIIVNVDNPPVVEHITLTTGVRDLKFSSGVLVAIDGDALGNLQLGSMLHMDQMVGCAMSTIVALDVAQLSVQIGDIITPQMNGFISVGLDRVVNELVHVVFHMYEAVALKAMPNYFETEIRETIVNTWLDAYNEENSVCPIPTLTLHDGVVEEETGRILVDFNKMFYDVDSNTDTQDETLSQPYGDLFAKVKDMIDNTFTALDETTGTPRINGDMIVPYTESQSGIPGTMVYEEEMFDMEGSLVDYGGLDSYAVRVWNVRLENLDTFASPFYIARPVPEKPFNLDNEITMGIPKPMKISFEMLFKLTGSAASMNNHVKLSLGLEKLEAFASLLAKIDVTQLLSLQLKNVFNLYCWMDTILEPENHENPTAGIKDMIMGFQSIVMGLECVDCSGYMLHDLDDRLDSDSAIQAFTKVVNKILNVTAASVTSPEFQDRIDHYLSQSNVLCENPDQVATPWVRDESAAMSTFETSSSPDFTLAAASCATFLLVVIFACCLSSMSKRRKIEKQFRMSDKEREAEAKEKHVRKERRKAINARSVSMFRSSDEIPRYIRYGMPIIILITVGLFVSGHLSIGAAVAMKVQLAGDNIEVDNFFEFSMAKSTYDTWVAGAKELAILIILFSGLWPYTKQFTVLYLWMTPPSCVTMETRGSVFQWLDTLGKWSMIDIFVLVMSLVAFQIDVSSPIYDFLPNDFYGLKLQVVPLWGLYSNLLAQIVSQISSHFIIKYHRNICAAKEQEQQRYELRVRKEIAFDGDDDEKIKKQEEPSRRRRRLSTWVDMHGGESLFTQSDEMTSLIQARTALRDHIFRVAANPESERNGRTWQRFRLKKRMSGFVVILGMATIAILSWGMITDSLALEVWGILGVAIDIGEPGASYTKHSVYSIVTSVINQAFEMWHENMGLAMGQFFLAMIFSLCCYIVPVLQVILLCVMWTKPMRLKSMKRCYVMNEILSAWQYMEVYLVAVLLAIFQLGQISSYMMNEQCLSMNSGFQMLVDSDMIEEKDAQCFYLYAEAMIGSYILLGSAFLLCILNQLVGGAAVAAIEDREYRAFQTANRLNNTAGSGAICGNPGPGAETFRWVLTMSPTLFGVGSRLRRRGWLSEDLNNTIMIVDGDRSIVSDSVNLCDGDAVQYKDIESGAVKKSKWEVLVELNFFGTEHLMYFDTHTGRLYSTRPSSSVEDKKVDVVSKAPFARVVKKDQRRRRSSASDSPCASGHILVSRSARARSVRWGSNESPLVKNIIDKVDMQGQFTPPPPFSMSKHRHARKIEMARRDAPVHIPSPPSFSSSDYDRDVMEKKKKIPPPIVPRTKRPLIAAPPKPIVQLQDVVLAPSLPSKRNKKKVNKSKSRPRPPPVPVRKKRGACGNYRLDLSADYGLCKCGFPKNEHISNSYYYHH